MMPAFVVGLFAILISGIMFLIQRYTQVKYGIKEKQKIMKEKQKVISDIYKNEDTKDPNVMKRINDMQKEVMKISMEMMKTNFKNMIWIMLLSLLVFAYIATYIGEPFPVGNFWKINAVFVWYIVVSLFANLLYKGIFYLLEKNEIVGKEF